MKKAFILLTVLFTFLISSTCFAEKDIPLSHDPMSFYRSMQTCLASQGISLTQPQYSRFASFPGYDSYGFTATNADNQECTAYIIIDKEDNVVGVGVEGRYSNLDGTVLGSGVISTGVSEEDYMELFVKILKNTENPPDDNTIVTRRWCQSINKTLIATMGTRPQNPDILCIYLTAE